MKNKRFFALCSTGFVLFFLVLSMFSACSADSGYKAGTYVGVAEGKHGPVKVEVQVDDKNITGISVLENSENGELTAEVIKSLPQEIIAKQSLAVDTVTGASTTSYAIIEAVEAALKQAGASDAAIKELKTAKAKAVEAGNEEYSADLVVLGAGASGISAAVAAGDRGLKVVLVEKTAKVGGASLFSWAGLGYDSSYQKAAGVNPDKEGFIQDWIKDKHWRLDVDILRRFIDESGATWDWLKTKGWDFTFLPWFDGGTGHMLPDYAKRPALYQAMLDESVTGKGGKVLLETTGKKLLLDKNGAVVGLEAQGKTGNKIVVHAKAVVIATGGYAGNKEMVKKAFGFEGVNGGLSQNIGEGLEMSWAAGAAVPRNFGGQMLHQTLVKANLTEFSAFQNKYPMILAYVPSVLNVGPQGKRFRAEDATLVAVAAANTSAFQGPYHLVVVSQKTLDTLKTQGLNGIGMDVSPGMPPEYKPAFELNTPWDGVNEVFDAMVSQGWGYKGNTLEELAQNAGMDPALFVENYKRYEEQCLNQKDADFGKASRYLFDQGEEGPFYAIIAEINNLGSVGGLNINNSFQVLNADKNVIPGLFAVGLESEGVIYNDTYVGNGAGIAWAFTSGRLGGNDVADWLEKK